MSRSLLNSVPNMRLKPKSVSGFMYFSTICSIIYSPYVAKIILVVHISKLMLSFCEYHPSYSCVCFYISSIISLYQVRMILALHNKHNNKNVHTYLPLKDGYLPHLLNSRYFSKYMFYNYRCLQKNKLK